LVIGVGERASRHEISDWNDLYLGLTPHLGMQDKFRRSAVNALIACGAATLEPKKEPLRIKHFFGVKGTREVRSGPMSFHEPHFVIEITPRVEMLAELHDRKFQFELYEVETQ
jgi:hypothetical protein